PRPHPRPHLPHSSALRVESGGFAAEIEGMIHRSIRFAAVAALLVSAAADLALARQVPPTLSVSTDVAAPGSVVIATITGQPGQHYVLLGSTIGGGYTFGGVNLALGPDIVVIASGVFDGTGTAVVSGVPPFQFTTLDRYYLQAVT